MRSRSSVGILAVRPTGTDPLLEVYSLEVPAVYDRLVIRLRADEGVDNADLRPA